MSHPFRELLVWQKARDMVRDIDVQTRKFPKEGRYGLAAPMGRSAVLVPRNIAEGLGRFNQG